MELVGSSVPAAFGALAVGRVWFEGRADFCYLGHRNRCGGLQFSGWLRGTQTEVDTQ